MKIGRASLELVSHAIRIVPSVFKKEEWALQVVSAANLYTDKILGKNSANYRFPGVEKLGLKPLKFTQSLAKLYVSISRIDFLKRAVVEDQRSFSMGLLENICATAEQKNLITPIESDLFRELLVDLEKLHKEKQRIEEIIGDDFPDEFACSLTYDMMKDPVFVSTCKIVCERSTIEKQITLNGEINPFTRQTLRKSDLVPATELKAKIEAWIQQKMQAHRAK